MIFDLPYRRHLSFRLIRGTRPKLLGVIAGLFLAAAFKEALWPKAGAIGGVVFLLIRGGARAITSCRQVSSCNQRVEGGAAPTAQQV